MRKVLKRMCGTTSGTIPGAIAAVWMIVLFSLGVAQQDEGRIKTETELINVDVAVKDGLIAVLNPAAVAAVVASQLTIIPEIERKMTCVGSPHVS